MRLLAAAAVALASHAAFHAQVHTIPASVKAEIVSAGEWHSGCPVPLSGLRLLSVTYLGFDGRPHWGTLVVNADATDRLTAVFRRLYAMRFPIHHMQLSDTYGSGRGRPADGDFTASTECRQAAASPCAGLGNKRTGSWSEHAYGEAVDLNPVENPYVGCGMTRDRTAISYMNRSNVRKGMVTPAVVAAFVAAGWGWGGSWSGSTKDYMHFSATGH